MLKRMMNSHRLIRSPRRCTADHGGIVPQYPAQNTTLRAGFMPGAKLMRRPARSLARLFPLGSDRGRHTLAGLGRRRQGDRMRRREFIALLGAVVIASSRDVI